MAVSSITSADRTVDKAGVDDVDRLCRTLSAAFFADPVMSWCYPDPDRRRRVLHDLFRTVVVATLPHGGVDMVAGARAGAIWVPPDAELDDEQLAADILDVSGDDAAQVVTLMELVDPAHPTDVTHRYLFALGTRPEWQSHGLGSALLRAVLDRCDEDGTPAYLEASSEGNKRLYLRHGFEVRSTVRLPDGPPVWCMWRDPTR